MPQSLAQIYLHTIFSTKGRFPFLESVELQRQLHSHLAVVATNLGCDAVQIGGVADHVHLLTAFSRTISVAEFVKETKRVSSLWLHERGGIWEKFHWQSGYGVFSVSASHRDRVKDYILGQRRHHRRVTFQDEDRSFLDKHGVEFDERYVWD